MNEMLRHAFSHVCGQVNVWVPGGIVLPMCQRCTGLYAGGAYAAVVIGIFRPKPTGRLLWAHGIAMLLMIPFGYHFVPQTAITRTITGQLFGYGLVYFLFLNSADKWDLWRDSRAGCQTAYATCLLAGIPILLSGVLFGSTMIAQAIGWIGAVGLAVCVVLVITNLYFFTQFGFQRWRAARAAR